GSHTYYVRAVDNAGNVESTATYTWTVDTVAPSTVIDSGPSQPYSTSSSANFVFHATDATSGVNHLETQLDGGGFATQSSPQSFSGLSEGSHTFQVRAVDNAGNVESAVTYTWSIDLTDPLAFIDSMPTNPSTSSSATFDFHGSDTGGSGVYHLE